MAEGLVMRAGGKLVDLAKDRAFIDAIAGFAEKYHKLIKTLGTSLSPEAILQRIEHPDSDPAWQAAVEELGLAQEAERIHLAIAEVRELLDGNLAPLHKLITPVGAFDPEVAKRLDLPLAPGGSGLIEWPVISRGAALGADSAEYAIELGAEARLEIEAGAPWPFGGDDLSEPLMRIGIKGKAVAGGKATLPFGIGFARVAADSAADLALDLHFHSADPRRTVAAALA